MQRSVFALLATRPEAEAAAERLAPIGIERGSISIAGQNAVAADGGEAGFFDHLVEFLLPDGTPGGARRGGFLLTAEVEPDQVDRAAGLLESDAIPAGESGADIREQIFEFRETAEELVVDKDAVVREEIVLRKEVEERVEDIEGTVRHTEVEVEELKPAERKPVRFGGRTALMRDFSRPSSYK